MAAAELMKVLYKVKPVSSFLGSRISFRCARRSVTDETKLSRLSLHLPVLYLERLSDFLDPNRSKKLLLQMVETATFLTGNEKRFQGLRKWITDDFPLDGKMSPINTGEISKLVHTCTIVKDPKFFSALLSVVQNRRMELHDCEINALLGAMASFGWNNLVRVNFRKMEKQGFDFRIGTLFSILFNTVQCDDLELAADAMHKIIQNVLDKPIPMEQFSMVEVMKGCVGRGKEAVGLVDKVVEWHCLMDRNMEDLDSFIEWLHSGVCRNCGNKLILYSISTSDHALLQSEIAKVITMLEERHLRGYPRNSFLRELTGLVDSKHFGVAIDVMNVGQLFKVIKELKMVTDEPILAVTRWKDGRGDKLTKHVVEKLKDVYNTHVFFVDHSVDDDLYTLYGALSGSQDTLLVTNDHLADKTKLVSDYCKVVLAKWKKTHVVKINHGDNFKITLKMPPGMKVAMRQKDENLHLPYTDGTNNYHLCIQNDCPPS